MEERMQQRMQELQQRVDSSCASIQNLEQQNLHLGQQLAEVVEDRNALREELAGLRDARQTQSQQHGLACPDTPAAWGIVRRAHVLTSSCWL